MLPWLKRWGCDVLLESWPGGFSEVGPRRRFGPRPPGRSRSRRANLGVGVGGWCDGLGYGRGEGGCRRGAGSWVVHSMVSFRLRSALKIFSDLP